MSNSNLSRLIILGAGASVECGVYPTGAQFLTLVKQMIDRQEKLKRAQQLQKTWDYHYLGFLKNLLASGHTSIDAHISFIDDEKEKKFLKAVIFSIITTCTAYSSFTKSFETNWYHELAKLIFPTTSLNEKDQEKKLDKIKKNLEKVQIITFNYDVSLELYLLDRAKDFFGTNDRNTLKNFLNSLLPKIYHVYGSVACELIDENELDESKNSNYSSCAEELINISEEHRKDPSEKLSWEVCLCRQSFAEKASGKTPKEMIESEKFFSDFKALFGPDEDGHDRKLCIHHKEGFLDVVFECAKKIYEQDKSPFLSDRIKVIDREKDKKLSELIVKTWDVIFILGYGFDRLNNERLGFSNPNFQWKLGCFITNFGGKEKLKKRIYQQLSKGNGNIHQRTDWKIPTDIVEKTVSGCLQDCFDLFESPQKARWIKTEHGEEPFYYMQRIGER